MIPFHFLSLNGKRLWGVMLRKDFVVPFGASERILWLNSDVCHEPGCRGSCAIPDSDLAVNKKFTHR